MRASGLVERLAAMAGRRLPALSPQQLAETLDALARLQYEAPASFLKVWTLQRSMPQILCCATHASTALCKYGRCQMLTTTSIGCLQCRHANRGSVCQHVASCPVGDFRHDA